MAVRPVTAVAPDYVRSTQEQVARVRERQQAAAQSVRPSIDGQTAARDTAADAAGAQAQQQQGSRELGFDPLRAYATPVELDQLRDGRAVEEASQQAGARSDADDGRALAERAVQAYRTESQRASAENTALQQTAAEPLNAQLQVARERLDALDARRIDRVEVSDLSLSRIGY